jgi:hypothetical protein
MEEKPNSPNTLQIWPIVSEAVHYAWGRRRHFGSLLILPTIFFIIYKVIEDKWFFPYIESASPSAILKALVEYLVLGIPYSMVFAIFAIACHRSILLGPYTVPSFGFLGWSYRETRFLLFSIALASLTVLMIGLSILLGVVSTLPLALFADTFKSLFQAYPWLEPEDGSAGMFLAYVFAVFLVAYSIGRLSLVFPATAVDRCVSFKWAWLNSEHHDVRLAFLVGVVPLASILFQDFIIQSINEWLAPIVHYVLKSILYCVLLVVEIAILSISYREIGASISENSESEQGTLSQDIPNS